MKRFGLKMPKKARSQSHQLRVCPVCTLPKLRRDFRQSNQNAKVNVICWQCRRENPKAVAEFYAVGKYKPVTPESSEDVEQRFKSVSKFLKLRNQRRKTKGKEVMEMAEVEKQALALARFPSKVAAILGKTFLVRGDDFTLTDDEAIQRIRDSLDEIDETLIERNKNKRLSR